MKSKQLYKYYQMYLKNPEAFEIQTKSYIKITDSTKSKRKQTDTKESKNQ
ncbi:MAG: hypothetical protein ABIK15_07135 [Pseudomonadota bacterium]